MLVLFWSLNEEYPPQSQRDACSGKVQGGDSQPFDHPGRSMVKHAMAARVNKVGTVAAVEVEEPNNEVTRILLAYLGHLTRGT
jgi:hypothetical protein